VAAKHLTNFYKVTDNLYRCAQPDEDGLREAKALGIRTVINLRFFHSDPVTTGVGGMAADRIAQNAWHVESEDVVKFLSIVSDEKNGPFLVHCHHGSDRTGVSCAMYRIVVQGWSKDDAIDEMTHGGYGFHPLWTNIVKYVREADVEKIRRLVDKKETPEAKDASGVSGTKRE
jgi:protein tyrosine/serine phosphatase